MAVSTWPLATFRVEWLTVMAELELTLLADCTHDALTIARPRLRFRLR